MLSSKDARSRAAAVALGALIATALLPSAARSHFQNLCAEEDHCTTDAQCNDGDPCTQDFCDPAADAGPNEGCCEHDALTPCIDTLLCYAVAASKGSPKPPPVPDVGVTDPFEDLRFDVTEMRRLCIPADRDGAGIHDPVTHLDQYQIVPVSKRASRATARHVKAETAIGALLLDVIVGDKLLVPAAADLTAPPPLLPRTDVDHLKCYDVKASKGTPKFPQGVRLTLADQLSGAPKVFAVGAPTHLCTAAEVNGEGYTDACNALLCYGVQAAPKQPRFSRVKGVWVRDRFDLRRVDSIAQDEACLPAVIDDRTCVPRGFACEADGDCSTGHCVDGVCCESACEGTCYACVGTLTGEPHGTCAPIETGNPDTTPTNLCGPNTGCSTGACSCDGLGDCTTAQ